MSSSGSRNIDLPNIRGSSKEKSVISGGTNRRVKAIDIRNEA